MMQIKYLWQILRTCVLGALLLMFILSIARPLTAASQENRLDIARMDAFVNEQMQRHGIPGLALGIVEGDQIIHLQGFGKADQSGDPVTPQTPFLLASVSKPITALAMMQLVEAGKVELDTPVQHYLPEFRMADAAASAQITLRHLLLHTSGIPATSCDTRIDAQTLQQYVAELQTVELSAPVGARHDYCSGNYNVLGRAIEVVSGQSYGSYVQHHIFAPLEMHHSFTSEQEALEDGMAQGYQWLFGLLLPMHYRYNPSQLPSGYLISSAEDMTHFLIAQLNGGSFGNASLVSPKAITAMQRGGVRIGPGQGEYGLGWRIGALGGVPSIFHYGDNFNYHALLIIEPQTRRGAVLLMNANNVLGIATAFREIEVGVAQLLAGEEPAPASWLSLRVLYLLIDLPLALLLGLVLWPLLKLRHWYQVQQGRKEAHLRLRPVGLRIAVEIGVPLLLLAATRLALDRMGAQSWFEGLSLFLDIGLWLWTIALLMLGTGVIRLVLFLRLCRRAKNKQKTMPLVAPAL